MRGETKKKVHDSIYRKCKLIYSERKMNGCLGMQIQGGVGERDYQEIHKKLLGVINIFTILILMTGSQVYACQNLTICTL